MYKLIAINNHKKCIFRIVRVLLVLILSGVGIVLASRVFTNSISYAASSETDIGSCWNMRIGNEHSEELTYKDQTYMPSFHLSRSRISSKSCIRLTRINVNFQSLTNNLTLDLPAKVPMQSDHLFAAYPSWWQNFANYHSASLNTKYWNALEGKPQNSNHEAEYYTSDSANLRISDKSLIIQANKSDSPTNPSYTSADIDTRGKVTFLYGRLDVVAKIPTGVGTWPAIWLLPADLKYENLSPPSDENRYLNGGEIDMVEEVGYQPNKVYGVVHTFTSSIEQYGVGDYSTVTVPHNNTVYNMYSMLWTPTSISFEINNVPFFTYNKPNKANYTTWPFNVPFYLVANLALGGSWGGLDTAQFPGNGIDNSIFPTSMQVASIYYYPYKG